MESLACLPAHGEQWIQSPQTLPPHSGLTPQPLVPGCWEQGSKRHKCLPFQSLPSSQPCREDGLCPHHTSEEAEGR